MVKEGDIDLNVSPLALDKLLGYVLAFKIKVQPKFNNVVVLRYSNDLDLINEVVLEIQEFRERFVGHDLGPEFINFLNYMCGLFFLTVLVYSMSISFLI